MLVVGDSSQWSPVVFVPETYHGSQDALDADHWTMTPKCFM